MSTMSKSTALAALCALVALMGVSSAWAATFVREQTSTTGTVLPSGGSVSSSLLTGTQAVIVADVGTVTCSTSSVRATVGASGGALVTGTLNVLSLTGCTDTIPLVTLTSCSLNWAPSMFLTGTGMGGTMTISQSSLSLSCPSTGGVGGTCTWANSFWTTVASISEVSGASHLSFSNARLYSSGACGSAGFTATYAPLVTTGTNVPVYLNDV